MNRPHRKETGSRGTPVILLRRSNRISIYISLGLWQSSLLCHAFSRIVTKFCRMWHYPLTRGPTQWFELTDRGESQGHIWAGYILWALWMIQLDLALASLHPRPVAPILSSFALHLRFTGHLSQHVLLFEFISLGQSHPESWILEWSPKLKIWKVQYFWIKYFKIKDYNSNILSTWVTEGVLKPWS